MTPDKGRQRRSQWLRSLLSATAVTLGVLIVTACGRAPEAPSPTAVVAEEVQSPIATATGTPGGLSTTPRPTPSPSPSATATTAATATPTQTPTPAPVTAVSPVETPTASTAAGPTITYFEAAPPEVDPGEPVTLTWASEGATRAVLYKLFYSGQLPPEGIDVPPVGRYVYEISESERNWGNFLLYVWDEANRNANAGASVVLRCPEIWFFDPPPEDICPTSPLISAAAEQHFEGGTMIWIAAEDAIYVLFKSPTTTTRWSRFEDRWDETLPESDPNLAPPAGRQQPVRGFGLVWREQPQVQEELGWALDEEQGYTAVMQRTTRYKYNAWYLLALDGDVWYLGPERSSWDKVPVTELKIPLD